MNLNSNAGRVLKVRLMRGKFMATHKKKTSTEADVYIRATPKDAMKLR